MITLNSKFSYQCPKTLTQSPVFAGKGKENTDPQPNTALQQDLWQQLDDRRKHEKGEQRLIKKWEKFQKEFQGYTAPAMQEALQGVTDNLQAQAHLSSMYTNGARERYEEAGKLKPHQKALATVKSKLGIN